MSDTFPTLEIILSADQLNRQEPDTDNVSMLVLIGATGLPNLPHLVPKVVYSIKQVQALGLTAAYDATTSLLYYHHVSEYFLENPNGELYLMTVDGMDLKQVLGDSSNAGAIEPAIIDANGRIKQIAITSGDDSSSFFIDDIINDNLIEKAQGLADRLAANHIKIDVIFLEGFGFNETAGDAPDLRVKETPNVALVVGGDRAVANTNVSYNGYGAIGTALGCSTRKKVHESVAWTKEENNLASPKDDRFLSVKISSDLSQADKYLSDVTALKALHNKGYIFPRRFPYLSGFYWNQSNNCMPISSDFKNIESVQVINKAARIIGRTLAPHINETFDVTSEGRLTDIVKRTLAAEIRQALENNMGDNISAIGSIIVDPAKDANNQPYPSILVDSTLRAIVGIRPKGKTEIIWVLLGYQP